MIKKSEEFKNLKEDIFEFNSQILKKSYSLYFCNETIISNIYFLSHQFLSLMNNKYSLRISRHRN